MGSPREHDHYFRGNQRGIVVVCNTRPVIVDVLRQEFHRSRRISRSNRRARTTAVECACAATAKTDCHLKEHFRKLCVKERKSPILIVCNSTELFATESQEIASRFNNYAPPTDLSAEQLTPKGTSRGSFQLHMRRISHRGMRLAFLQVH
jgi:hypothetical protein